jgi:predicted tellurium resistance membrane protein TerC
MDLSEGPIAAFFRRHPRLHLCAVLLLCVVAIVILLGGYRTVGLVYKAF